MKRKDSSRVLSHHLSGTPKTKREKFRLQPNENEHLVGVGFRCWMAGYQTGDINCWESAWNHIAGKVGVESAKALVSDLSCWVRTIHTKTARPIEVYPMNCAGFCRDECMAISLIAASQNDQCPALRACAFALLDSNELDEVIDLTDRFAMTLKHHGRLLSQKAVINTNSFMGNDSASAMH